MLTRVSSIYSVQNSSTMDFTVNNMKQEMNIFQRNEGARYAHGTQWRHNRENHQLYVSVKKGLKNVAFKLLWQHLEHKLQDILDVWNIYSIRVTKFQVQMNKVKVSFVHQEDKVSLKCIGKTRILIPKSSISTPKSLSIILFYLSL